MSSYYTSTQDDDVCLSPTNSCTSSDDSGPLDPKRRKYQCAICQKYFSRPSALRTHSYTHTGEKPFECDAPGCGRRFAVISNLRRHFKVHRKVPSATFSGGSHVKIPASERLRCVQQLMERTAHRQHQRTPEQEESDTHETASCFSRYHYESSDSMEKQQQQQQHRSWMMPPSPPLSTGIAADEYSTSYVQPYEEMSGRVQENHQFMAYKSHYHRQQYQYEYQHQHPHVEERSQQHTTSPSYYCDDQQPPQMPPCASSTSSQAQHPTTATLRHTSPSIYLSPTDRPSSSSHTSFIRDNANSCCARD